MKIKLLVLSIFATLLFPLGLRALIIPQTATLLSKSGAGIANSYDVNPALLSSSDLFVSFSRNSWLGGVSGQKISMLSKNKTYISFETLSVTDIELRDEIANDSPLGFFGAYWYALDLSRSKKIDIGLIKNLDLGYRVKMNFSKLYTETMKGYTIDVGFNKKINNTLSLAFVAKNIGKESSSNLRTKTIPTIGIGATYMVFNSKLKIIGDLLNQYSENFIKVACETKLPFGLDFIFGSTYSKSYKDFSMGIKLDLKGWSLVYGNLNHDNSILGNPTSIEIKKYF
jgi:hypothetical protein